VPGTVSVLYLRFSNVLSAAFQIVKIKKPENKRDAVHIKISARV